MVIAHDMSKNDLNWLIPVIASYVLTHGLDLVT